MSSPTVMSCLEVGSLPQSLTFSIASRAPSTHRLDQEACHVGGLVRLDSLADEAFVADERCRREELVGNQGGRLLLATVEAPVLDRSCLFLEAVAPEDVVLEVPVPGTHAADIERGPGAREIA
jgi:hypothetical protein